MNIRKNLLKNEKGLVSIVVTMIFMIVLTIIVLSFAQIARREQRQSLDRALSQQAYYAAESGINTARKVIDGSTGDYSKYNEVPQDKTDCSDVGGVFKYNLKGDDVKTTCVLIDQKPKKLDWTRIDPTKTTNVDLKAYDAGGAPTNISKINFEWQNDDAVGNTVQDSTIIFPKFNDWKPENVAPVIRVELIPVPSSGNKIVRNNLVQDTFTAFLRPVPTGTTGGTNTLTLGDASGASGNRGKLVMTECNPIAAATKKCSMEITGLNSHEYYLRMKTEYRGASVSMTAKDSAGNPVRIGGAQVEIDATGKAVDVVKRIRVKIPYDVNNYLYPEGVIESGDSVCKKLSVVPNPGITTDGCSPAPLPAPPIVPAPTKPATGQGNSIISGCAPSGCIAGGPSEEYQWKYYYFNISGNPNNIVKSCKWVWSDGVVFNGSPLNKADACLDGQYTKRTYPTTLPIPPTSNCRNYELKLIISFNNGFADAVYTKQAYVPRGTKGIIACDKNYVKYP